MSLYSLTDNYAGMPKNTKKFTFDASSGTIVNLTNNTILSVRHKMETGQPLFYNKNGGVVITGLTDLTVYYAIKIDADTIKLATTKANAVAGTAVDLTVLGTGTTHQLSDASVVFVSTEEAQLPANKAKGLNGAGWWKIIEFTDSDGQPRYKTELLVSMNIANATSGDATDDLQAADVDAVISISVQPANQNTVTGGATFGVTASVTPSGSVTYQWQKSLVGTTKFADVSGQTASTTVLAGQTSGNTGDRYRVVLTSTTGAPKVVSTPATLTFVS